MKRQFQFVIKLIIGPDPTDHFIEINPFEWFFWFVFKETAALSERNTRQIYIMTKFVDERETYDMDSGRLVNISWIRCVTLRILCLKICWTRRYYQPTLKRVYGVRYDHTADSREGQKMRAEILEKINYWSD